MAARRSKKRRTSERATTRGLKPILSDDPEATHTLILGSYPSLLSFDTGKDGEPFGNRSNAFWWIVGDCLGFRRLPTALGKDGATNAPKGIEEHLLYDSNQGIPFDQQCEWLKRAGFALWDVMGCTAAERPDSMDSSIKDAMLNPIHEIIERHPNINRICFTGKSTAALFAGEPEKVFETKITELRKKGSPAAVLDQMQGIAANHAAHRKWLSTGNFTIVQNGITNKVTKLVKLVTGKGLRQGRKIELCALHSPSPAAAGIPYTTKRKVYKDHCFFRTTQANIQETVSVYFAK